MQVVWGRTPQDSVAIAMRDTQTLTTLARHDFLAREAAV